ncbi:MAG TPA: ADP-ribosylglycohydrolase family protein [Nitrolancea sp.]|nr:ADP-ribosylglycohydrolase family protein [Nitrolancea sp.]
MTTLRDRYRGCLLGLAIGDALGAPVEFINRDEIALRFGVVREMRGGGWLDTKPGEYTDDTQMALAIARSIAELGRIDPADIGARFVRWMEGMPKDIGNTTLQSLGYLAAGVPWDEAGARTAARKGDSGAGNGSIMRTAPIGLACRNDPAGLIRQSIDISRITHADPRCTWSCVALCQAIAALINETGDPLAAARAGIEEPEVVETVERAATIRRVQVQSGGYVLHTLSAALWAFVNHESFEDVVVAAVNLGGDADSSGAVSGALAGARYGASAIPERWLSVLQSREELTDLADRLLEIA